VENTSVVAEKNCLKNLGEEVPRCRFFEGATFTDVVKEVLKRVHVLVFST